MSHDERRKEMNDFLDELLVYLEESGEYELVEKVSYMEAVLQADKHRVKFQIIVQEK